MHRFIRDFGQAKDMAETAPLVPGDSAGFEAWLRAQAAAIVRLPD